MQKRANRLVVVAILVAAGVIGGIVVFEAHRRVAALAASSSDLSTRIERMIATTGDISSAQQAYVAPGQPDQPWLEHSAMLLKELGDDAAALRPRLGSSDAAGTLDQIEQELQSVLAIDSKVRENLRQGQNLLAADLIFSEGRDTVAMLVAALRALNDAEQTQSAMQRASIERQQWGALGLLAFLWLVGLAVLVPIPIIDMPVATGAESPPIAPTATDHPAASPVDLAAVADVCGALARTTDTASLRNALGRIGEVLDARGVVVWMGAGEELFPALSYGYDAHVVERMGPISRNAGNATAEAWRTGRLRTVAGDILSHGAVVAPLMGIGGCVGVLAAEVPYGREEDPSLRAVAAMIAAQLAGIVSAWPAGSAAAPETANSGPRAASGRT